MMDLTQRSLPNTVSVGGRDFSVYTDFRLWMRFENEVAKLIPGEMIDVRYLFKNEYPQYCSLPELFTFSRPKSPLPRVLSHKDIVVLDYEIDAELIYSAFMQQYRIDLLEVKELHWHKFLALLKGLSEGTKLREVMGYRCYEKNSDRNSDPYQEMRNAWEIERPATEQEIEDLEDFNKMFGG